MEKITLEQIPEMFDSVGEVFREKKEELCEMDAKLGDGDLGLTMSKGYTALPDLIREECAAEDAGKMLMKAGMKMASIVPSTMGFLMSSGVMEGGKALKGVKEMDGRALTAYLVGFASGIQKRGKCQLGQRTIYDAVFPAAQAAKTYTEDHSSAALKEVIAAALKAAKDGAEATKDMVPVFGKAAVHAAKSAGVADQGAMAGYYMILGMHHYICK